MNKHRILYNPLAGKCAGQEQAKKVEAFFPEGDVFTYDDVTTIENYGAYLAELGEDEDVVLLGGDGTVKKAPVVKKKEVGPNDLCPCGSGKKYKKCCGLKESN